MALEVRRYIQEASAAHGPDADFNRARLEALAAEVGVDDLSSVPGSTRLMRAIVDALVLDNATRDSPTRVSRCWAQLLNRAGTPLAAAFVDLPALLLVELNWVGEQLRQIDDPIFAADLRASLAAATVWLQIDNLEYLVGEEAEDRALAEFMTLYAYRYRFAAPAILDHLSGHVDVQKHPIKAAFACFAHQLLGDSRQAVSCLGPIHESEGSLPLSAAKLISYSLAVASLTETSLAPGSTADDEVQVRRPFGTAVAVWEAHGADEQLYRAKASYAAVCQDAASVNASINAAVDVLRRDPDARPAQFIDLMQYRSDLMARLDISQELTTVVEIRGDAETALSAARETATQVPTIVGLFTAVIALVVGSSQLAQDLDAQGRVLVVASLGVVLLGFVVALAGVTSYVSRSSVALWSFAAFLGVVTGAVGILLTVLYVVAGL